MFLVHSYSISFLLPLPLYLVLSSVFSGLCSFFTCYLQVLFPCKDGLLGCPFVQVFPFSILVKQHDRVIIFCLMLLRRLVSVPIGNKHFIETYFLCGIIVIVVYPFCPDLLYYEQKTIDELGRLRDCGIVLFLRVFGFVLFLYIICVRFAWFLVFVGKNYHMSGHLGIGNLAADKIMISGLELGYGP